MDSDQTQPPLSQVAGMLAGEEDTEVTVGIKPQGVGGVLREGTLTRRTLVGAEPSSVESRTTPDQDRSGVGSA